MSPRATGRDKTSRTADRFAEYGPPRRVEGGLRARSTRGAIGRSWWSRRFLEVLESFALGTRLTRGRSYARAGQVMRLDVAPGEVTAVVQGSRSRPYEVHITLATFPMALWSRVEEDLATQAFFSARLLAGDLPAELEELFAAAGAPLFPAGMAELGQRCSCPDAAVPCKHLAATFYLLAEAFDADPFALLHWRGRSRDELLDQLRVRRGTAVAARSDSDSAPDLPVAGAARSVAGLPPVPLADAAHRFWSPPVPLPDRPPTLVTGTELLLRQLGAPAPTIGGPGLVERLRRAYRRLGEPDAR
ncbi:SWIM zinc finger family protein [Salinispora arenicola]|uniref:SWIM zinc finger family protein n=1 Tax=Salinispora arenicola TaxID=168697 RepID=UPI0003A1A17A|nr:SWIM zinc finger family protein [Salinispora arenicola]